MTGAASTYLDELNVTMPPLRGEVSAGATALDLLNGYAHIFAVAFLVTLLATPIVRRIAVASGVVDRPDESRKQHRTPVAYLGGAAVFLGLITSVAVSYIWVDPKAAFYPPVPLAVVVGMIAIAFTGLADDVWKWDPRLKIAGQLVAAAALAIDDVGVRVAEGLLTPLLGPPDRAIELLGAFAITSGDLYYCVGTAIIAIFVLGGCNAANLIDGLDGLLSGTVAIIAIGLLAISLLALPTGLPESSEEATNAGARVVLAVAVLGAALGFLPHNFNPATIFLGDCGSLLFGYVCVVIILMLGDGGATHLVFAGLIVFSVPIMDTTLAIIRRRLAGRSLSAADDQHLHHQLKRALGTVKRAVLGMYAISAVFALLGVTLAALVLYTQLRIRMIYAIALVLFSSIGVIAVKVARPPRGAAPPATPHDAPTATDEGVKVARK